MFITNVELILVNCLGLKSLYLDIYRGASENLANMPRLTT